MRALGLALALTAALWVGAARDDEQGRNTAEAHHEEVQKRSARGDAERLRPGCDRHYRMETFYRYTKRRYARRSAPLTEGQKLHIKHLALCLANRDKSDWAYAKKRKWRAQFRQRLAYYRLTPYSCGSAGRFAIPCYVVACESHYSWTAYNPSGARGPYQFLGWNVPWPVTSFADKLAHHRMARYLWNDSPSHWVCA